MNRSVVFTTRFIALVNLALLLLNVSLGVWHQELYQDSETTSTFTISAAQQARFHGSVVNPDNE